MCSDGVCEADGQDRFKKLEGIAGRASIAFADADVFIGYYALLINYVQRSILVRRSKLAPAVSAVCETPVSISQNEPEHALCGERLGGRDADRELKHF